MAKRNKILFAGLSSIFVLGLAVALVNKGNPLFENKAEECDHQLNHYDAVASTTESEGNYGYYICCKCHNSFFDAEATRQIGAGKPSTPRRIAEPTNAALKTLNASKMKFMDQSEFFTDYDNNGDVEYVTIAGKEAIRFSQSKTGYTVTEGSAAAENVGKAAYADGKAPSEFRFTLDKTLLLSSFEYDYLYWDVTDENVGSDAGITDKHAFFQVNTVASEDYHELNPEITSGTGNYAPFAAELENAKGEWDVDNLVWKHVKVTLAKPVKSSNFITKITGFTGEMYVANPVATYVEREYDAATGVDANYGTSIKDDLGLEEGTKYDAVPRILIKDTGITGTQYVNGDHLWGNYNYAAEGGIDITIPFKYSYDDANRDNYIIYYIYNGGNEAGVVVRLNSSSNDGAVSAYIYVMEDRFTSADTNIVKGAGNPGTYFMATGTGIVDGTDAYLRIRSVITNKATNKVATTAYVGKQSDGVDYPLVGRNGDNTDRTEITAVLGADYFNTVSNNKFRATMISNSATVAANTTINQSYALPTRVVLKNAEGLIYGTKPVAAGSKVALPNVKKAGNFLMGWYDQNGNRVTSETAISGETCLTARFETERAVKLMPSDYGFGTETFTTSSNIENANMLTDESKLQGASRLDIYINFKNNKVGAGNSYAIIGFPYDYVNAKSRVSVRFDTRTEMPYMSGYFFGAGSLGGAAEDNGTKFKDQSFVWNFNHNILIHMYIETVDAATGTYNVGAEFTDLGNGCKSVVTRQAVLETGDDCYSITDKRTNRLCFQKQWGDDTCSFTISDPFVL